MSADEKTFQVGMEVLLRRHLPRLRGMRIGLISHAAALNSRGATSAELLHRCKECRLSALFGPEHGYFGLAGAGAHVASQRRSPYGAPVFSLYGATRRPTAEMLKKVDLLVFDLQDLGVRCYTYVATLRYVLEAAAETGKPVIVTDRPIPLPNIVNGPMLDEKFSSFVAAIPAPFVYGMTPGETALWLKTKLALDVDLQVIPMRGYHREAGRGENWPLWLPPSPGIRTWETARTYPALVFAEALPALDVGRGTNLAFQVLGAPTLQAAKLIKWLQAQQLQGIAFHIHPYQPAGSDKILKGIRLAVYDPQRFHPAAASLAILDGLQKILGRRRLWRGAWLDFFDKLYGTDSIRRQLFAGCSWRAIAGGWKTALARFAVERRQFLLYEYNA